MGGIQNPMEVATGEDAAPSPSSLCAAHTPQTLGKLILWAVDLAHDHFSSCSTAIIADSSRAPPGQRGPSAEHTVMLYHSCITKATDLIRQILLHQSLTWERTEIIVSATAFQVVWDLWLSQTDRAMSQVSQAAVKAAAPAPLLCKLCTAAPLLRQPKTSCSHYQRHKMIGALGQE